MVQTLEDIPRYEPIVERITPDRIGVTSYRPGYAVSPDKPFPPHVGEIQFDGKRIPGTLTAKLRKYGFDAPPRSEPERYATALKDFVGSKELYLRGTPQANGPHWFALVTGEFTPLDSKAVDASLRRIAGDQQPVVRKFRGLETVTLDYELPSALPGLEKLHLHANLGKHGIWGGDGSSSVRYGLSHYNGVCTNWTLFLHDDLAQHKAAGRVIHRGEAVERLDDIVESLDAWKGRVVTALDQSRERRLSKDDLEKYIQLYAGKRGLNQGIAWPLIRAARENDGITVHDAAYKITELCQRMTNSDGARQRLEYLAGELVLCTDKVLAAVQGDGDSEAEPEAS